MAGIEDEIRKDFLAEAKEGLEALDQAFVELEQDPGNPELIKGIFRTIHTIKGTAGFFGYTTLEGIAHFGEDILSRLRDGTVNVTEEVITVLLRAVDHIKAVLVGLEQNGKEPDDVAFLDFIVELRNFSDRIARGSGGCQPAPKQGPPRSGGQSGPPKEASAEARQTREGHEERAPAKATPKGQETTQSATGTRGAEGESAQPPAATPEHPDSLGDKTSSSQVATHQLTETHVRIDVHLLDKLMNLAGELVLSRNRLLQIASQLNNPDLNTANQRMSLVVTELQEQIMKTRMQPIGSVFNKFQRIVRDLARSAKKQVQLHIEGAETELDRSVIEIIKDPLTHLVRNSIDHGIETPDARIGQEKPAVGTLIMRAHHEGGQVIIEIHDDGAGIDPDKIRWKAVEKGLITSAQAEALSDKDALLLIFQPGFSTAQKVTNISGRGVGMDVVRTNIERLGGAVDLHSEAGKGTTVRTKIPLTLAIVPALIVYCAGHRYAIPQVNLVELVRLSREGRERDVQVIGNSEYYRLRGQILPLVRLQKILGGALEERNGDSLNIVVLDAGEQHFGLVVDSISDSEEIVVKPLGNHLKHIPCYAGATLMGDGRVALILDVIGIMSMISLRTEESSGHGQIIAEQTRTEEERQFLLLFSTGGDEHCALPLALVNRLDKISAEKIEMVGGREVTQYRGRSMSIIRLENYLPISPLPEQREYHLIVFRMNNKDIGILVSQIDDSLDLVIDVDDKLFRQDGILGSAIVKGHTTLFLDVYRLIEMHDPNFFSARGQKRDGTARILLAEDSTFYRNLISAYLVAAGYHVIAAEDGEQAWERLQEEDVQLVITDIEMPKMDGIELAQKIRRNTRTEKLPVMAVTSLAGDEDRRRGLACGINNYQTKLDREQVLIAIEQLLNEKP